jgi:hypothetical protein
LNMKNKQPYIETYIQQYRPDFDAAEPADCRWEHVARTVARLQASGCLIEAFVATERPVLDADWPDTMGIWARIHAHLDTLHPVAAQDDIEAFINSNRLDFDAETPDLRVWNELTHVAQPPVAAPLQVLWYRRLARAAAAIALVVAGAALGLWYAGRQQTMVNDQPPLAATAGMRMSDVSQEYARLEAQYEQDIQQKKAQLARFASTPGTGEMMVDIEGMDKIMEELRVELSNVPPGNREQIIRVMIEHYQAKAHVLQKVLEALQGAPTPGNSEQQTQQDEQNTTI